MHLANAWCTHGSLIPSQNRCCLAPDEQGDSRLLGILDGAERVARSEDRELDVDDDLDEELGPGRGR